MGASKQKMFEEQWEEDLNEWVYEKVANGELGAIAKRIKEIQIDNQTQHAAKATMINYNKDILQALCMVAHVVKSFGFNNPAVQATRLDPDNIADATRILDEAFSILESPVLGRRVSHLVEATLRGKWEELEEKLVQEDK